MTFEALSAGIPGLTQDHLATNTDMTIISSTGSDVGGLGITNNTQNLLSGNLLHSLSGWSQENGNPAFAINFSAPVVNFSIVFAGVFYGNSASITAYSDLGHLLGTVNAGDATGVVRLDTSGIIGPNRISRVIVTPGDQNDWIGIDNISFSLPVPEVSTWALMLLGIVAIAAARRRALG